MKYFIDTANLDEIKEISSKLDLMAPKSIARAGLAGITTNPNAINKVGVTNIKELETHLMNLHDYMEKISPFDQALIYVQHPDSKAPASEVRKFADVLRNLNKSTSKDTKFALKIPPSLVAVKDLGDLWLNVTGLASSQRAIACCRPWIKYVSIIPGRMEEAGINANNHLINAMRYRQGTEIITGSMRTIDGLKAAIKYGTVPTIGYKVFAQIYNETDFVNLWEVDDASIACVADLNTCDKVSTAFFEQMDKAGEVFAKNLRGTNE